MKKAMKFSVIMASLFLAVSCQAQDKANSQEKAQSSKARQLTDKQSAKPTFHTKLATQSPDIPVTNADDWRELDPENTLYIKTKYGTFVIELYPEIAPKHVEQIKTLTRQGFYNDISFHRVIDGFMNQTGDPRGDGTGDSDLPDIKGEMVFKRDPATMKMTIVGQELSPLGEVETGFYKALPIASKPAAQAMLTKDNKVDAFGMHCPGVASMARGSSVDSANSQFFLMRDSYPSLNAKYTVWGTTLFGRDGLKKIKQGTVGETKNFVPDVMQKVQIAADIPASERINVQVLKTDSKAFKTYVQNLKNKTGKYPKLCDITVPTILKK